MLTKLRSPIPTRLTPKYNRSQSDSYQTYPSSRWPKWLKKTKTYQDISSVYTPFTNQLWTPTSKASTLLQYAL